MATFEVHVFDSVGNAPIGPPVASSKTTTSASSQATGTLDGTAGRYVALRIKAKGGAMRYEIGDPDGSAPTAGQTSILLDDGDWEWIYVKSGTQLAVIDYA